MNLQDQLAFSIASSPNTYALLLGSGISRPAKIPTGWEILNDLINQIFVLSGEKTEDPLTIWFSKKYNTEPSYSNVLEKVAPTAHERTLIVKKYFESSPTEQSGKPTEGHKAIAKLVKGGFLKVIITTNFDRLTEQALLELNIQPTVIRSDSDLHGALPLVHSSCTVVKVNGDYLDSRIRNTAGELSSYEPDTTLLLNRIFDEYGLIVAGWSAQWDTALYDVIKGTPNRRFSSYWLSKGSVTAEAKDLMAAKSFFEIKIESADIFFNQLNDKVVSIKQAKSTHPVSLEILIATAKDYLMEERFKIRLYDLVMNETNNLIEHLNSSFFAVTGHLDGDGIRARVESLINVTTPLANLFQLAAMWGQESQLQVFGESFTRIINQSFTPLGGNTNLLALRKLPLTFLMYVSGMAGLSVNDMKLFNHLIDECVTPKDYDDETRSPLETLCLMKVFSTQAGKAVPGFELHHTPNHDIFSEQLFLKFSSLSSDKENFLRLFDRFEYLLGLKYAIEITKDSTIRQEGDKPSLWGPVGSFGWRSKTIAKSIADEIISKQENWIGFKSKLFKNAPTFSSQKVSYDHHLSQINWRW